MRPIPKSELDSLKRRLAVQTATTRVLAESQSLGSAITLLLAEIGQGLNWAVGEFWEPSPDGGVLLPAATWHSSVPGAAEFVAANELQTFRRGDGLPGLVWASRSPQVVEDIAHASNFPRRHAALASGFRSALAFPVQIPDEFFGVLEFFSTTDEHADPGLLATMAAVGSQLGQYVRRSRIEAARFESESRFRIFAETASDATFTIDENSVIIYVNPAVERIFGYQASELLGKSLTAIIPERMRSAHENGIRRYSATGRRNIPWSGVALPGLHKDGHEVPLEISFGEYRRDGTRYFTGIARDITDRVRHEKERQEYADNLKALVLQLEARSAEAEAASQAKSLFLANMSHELRTPINAIVGYGELLQMGVAGPLTKQQTDYLERVSMSARHLLGLITDILDLSKIEAGRLDVITEACVIAEDVRAALALVRPQAEAKSLEVKEECGLDAKYLGDSTRVRQVLVNLLSNAVKFTDTGGSVIVRCGVGTRGRADGEWVFASVEDTGIGISADKLSDIFQPFVQASSGTTRTHGGTGLGLSISQHLATLMNGEITAVSEVGKGSTFTLWLRAASPPSN